MDFSLAEAYYRISPKGSDNPMRELPGRSLLEPDRVRETLEAHGGIVQATGLALPASFAGLALNGLVMTLLLFLARADRLLDLSLDNLVYQLERQGDYVRPGFRVREARWTPVPRQFREAFLTDALSVYFREQIAPAVRAVAEAGGVKSDMIWSQFAGAALHMREYVEQNEPDGAARERLAHDYRVLTERLPGDIFGRKRNPYPHTPRYVDSPYKPGTPLMIRSGCCMYYCKADGQKCYNCPRLTEGEREQMRSSLFA